MKALKFFASPFAPLVACIALGALACQAPADEELEQAADVIQYMAVPANVARSMFMSTEPTGIPSEFVDYLFSGLGSAEWPDSASYAEHESLAREQANAVGAPLVPSNVAFVPHDLDGAKGRQIVVSADDANGMIILEGYIDPYADPVLHREIEFRLPQIDSRRRETLELFSQAAEDSRRDVGYGEY
jgi:hypothetical protein